MKTLRIGALLLVGMAPDARAAEFSKPVITGREIREAMCKDFALTAKQVRVFLKRATADVDGRDYLHYGCFVKGTAVKGTTPIEFRIEAGGVGEIRYPDGAPQKLGCEHDKTCWKKVFGEGAGLGNLK